MYKAQTRGLGFLIKAVHFYYYVRNQLKSFSFAYGFFIATKELEGSHHERFLRKRDQLVQTKLALNPELRKAALHLYKNASKSVRFLEVYV